MKTKTLERKPRAFEVRDGKVFYKGKINCKMCNGIIRCEIPEDYREPKIKLPCKKCSTEYDYYIADVNAVYQKNKD